MHPPRIAPRPIGLVFAKWILIATVAASPLTFVVAAIMQSGDTLQFAIASVTLIPLMAGGGYFIMVLACATPQRDEIDRLRHYWPSSWPLPWRLLKAINRQLGAFNRVFISVFGVLWSSFLFFWVTYGIVAGLLGQLRFNR